jgi:hypothetical protein
MWYVQLHEAGYSASLSCSSLPGTNLIVTTLLGQEVPYPACVMHLHITQLYYRRSRTSAYKAYPWQYQTTRAIRLEHKNTRAADTE